jgi:hypothetical protein
VRGAISDGCPYRDMWDSPNSQLAITLFHRTWKIPPERNKLVEYNRCECLPQF